MDEKKMAALVNNASQIGWRCWFSDMLIVLWMYLLRVQSGGLKVFAGSDADAISLPENVDASLWISKRKRAAFLRLRKRKQKQAGSLIARECSCSTNPLLCAFHAVCRLTENKAPGTLLWDLTAHSLQTQLRFALKFVGFENCGAMTLKAFRSGRATTMAANGASLQAILEAGEWKSRAVLNYVASEQVDDIAILDATLQQSDDEDA